MPVDMKSPFILPLRLTSLEAPRPEDRASAGRRPQVITPFVPRVELLVQQK